MRFTLSLLAASVGVIFAAGTTQVMAAGFALAEPDIGTMGTAYAGGGASADSATVVATNPAAMSRLDGVNFAGNNTLIMPNVEIKNPSGTAQAPNNTNKGDMVPRALLGSSFLTFPHVIFDKMSVGLGLYAPYGLKTNYEGTYQGRTFGDKSYIGAVTFQPTVSYAFLPNFSVGAGVTVNHFNALLTSGLSDAAPNATQEFSGARNAFGYNIGLLFSPIEPINVGLTYHSKVDYDIDGNVKVVNSPTPLPGVTFNAKGRGNIKITTPDSVELAATYKITPTVNLKASVVRTMWSTIGVVKSTASFNSAGITIQPNLANPLGAQLKAGIANQLNNTNSSEEINFNDTNYYGLGADWQVCKQLTLRAGLGYDTSAAETKYRSVRMPSANSSIFAVGANYKLSDKTNVDLAYNYIRQSNAHINMSKTDSLGMTDIYNADFQNSAHLIAFQLNYKF